MPEIDYTQFPTTRRTCNQYRCGGRMRDTGEAHELNSDHNIYACIECGHKEPWLNNPVLNGDAAELHLSIESKAYSGLSMMSDPRFYSPPKEKI